MEDYTKGKEDGIKSVKKTMILTGFISFIGIILIYQSKPVRSMFKEYSDQYFDGFYKGVIGRRWRYWWLGIFIFTSIALIANVL